MVKFCFNFQTGPRRKAGEYAAAAVNVDVARNRCRLCLDRAAVIAFSPSTRPNTFVPGSQVIGLHGPYVKAKKCPCFQLPSVPKFLLDSSQILVQFSVCFKSFTETKLFASSL